MFKPLSLLCLLTTLPLFAQAPTGVPPAGKPPTAVVAGIPANYDQDKVGDYTLPDPLKLNNGKPVRDAKTWTTKRRPEIVAMYETQQFGRAPGRPTAESFDVTDKGTPALNGKAIRKQVTIYLTADKQHKIDVLLYIPAAAKKPVPMLLGINFGANSSAVDDPGVKIGEVWDPKSPAPGKKISAAGARSFGHIDPVPLLDAGIGFATFYYGDVEPDFPAGFPNGIRAAYLKPGETAPAPDEWGAIAAWAWGMSRVQDYFETDPQIDSTRVAIHGVSRLGKTVMWACMAAIARTRFSARTASSIMSRMR